METQEQKPRNLQQSFNKTKKSPLINHLSVPAISRLSSNQGKTDHLADHYKNATITTLDA